MILEVPTLLPVTTPVFNPIVALPLLLVHVPPPASLNVIVEPRHTVLAPKIAVGNGLTVTVVVVMHPVPMVYVMVAVLVTATT